MTIQRVVIDFNDPSDPMFRVSKPGKSAYSANPDDLVLTEDSLTFRPFVRGTHNFGGSGSFGVALTGFTDPPFIMLKADDGSAQSPSNYYARMRTNLSGFDIKNVKNIARTITYLVFGNIV